MKREELTQKLIEIKEACKDATSREDIEQILLDILDDLDPTHPLFNKVVDSLTATYVGVAPIPEDEQTKYDSCIAEVEEYLSNSMKVRAFSEAGDISLLAEAIVSKYSDSKAKMTMAQFKNICYNCGFVTTLSSTVKLSNIIRKYYPA